MKQSLVVCALLSLVGGGCGGGDSAPSGAGGSAGGGGAPAGGAAVGGSSVNGGAPGGGGATGVGGSVGDAAAGGAAGSPGTGGAGGAGGMPATTSPTIPTGGDYFCMAGPQPSDAAAYIYGWSSYCVIITADAPPLTMMQKNTATTYCAFMVGGKEVPSCPRDNVAAYCQAPTGFMSGLTATRLLYKSSILPDADTAAANPLGACLLATQYDPAGKSLERACKGTISIKVDGQLKDFTKKRACSWKTDGTQSEYFVSADTETNDRIMFVIHKTADGKYDYGNGPVAKGASYLEGSTKAFVVPADPAAAMLTVTKYESKGAGLAATFSPGALKSGNDMRTLTEGVVDIQIVAP